MNVIGLGNTGCNIAKEFENYPQYNVYYIDTEPRQSKNSYLMSKYDHPEKYEANCPDLTHFLPKQGEMLFILGGSGDITGASLRILHAARRCDITVLYIKADQSLLSTVGQLQQRATFHILQEYARSGVFKEIFLLDNLMVSAIMGDVPIADYYSSINKMVVPMIHWLNVFNNSTPVMTTFSPLAETSRVKTISMVDMESGSEKMLFSLDNATEARYYYAISAKSLKEDSSLNNKIRNQIKERNVRTSFAIHETAYDNNFCYGIICSRQIQEF